MGGGSPAGTPTPGSPSSTPPPLCLRWPWSSPSLCDAYAQGTTIFHYDIAVTSRPPRPLELATSRPPGLSGREQRLSHHPVLPPPCCSVQALGRLLTFVYHQFQPTALSLLSRSKMIIGAIKTVVIIKNAGEPRSVLASDAPPP